MKTQKTVYCGTMAEKKDKKTISVAYTFSTKKSVVQQM